MRKFVRVIELGNELTYKRKWDVFILEIMDVFYKCVEEWLIEGCDKRVEYAMDQFDEWSKEFSEDESQIIAELIQNFRYYSKIKIRKIIEKLGQNIENKYYVSNADSVVSVVRKADGKGNSSHEYWLIHRELSGLSNDIYVDSLLAVEDKYWGNIKKIVFVDDCAGTGKQFTKFLQRLEKSFKDLKQNKSLKGKIIILIVVHVLEDALESIQNYADKNGLNIVVEYYWREKKAFYNKEQEIVDKFINLSKSRNINNILGYEGAEALMSFYSNSPNDTLGIFWCDSDKNRALFPRKEYPRAGWKRCNSEKQERNHQQYVSKTR